MKKKLKKIFQNLNVKKFSKHPKVFCISMQRTGTTSTGQFLKDHGFSCIGWDGDRHNQWSQSFFEKDYDSIFNSLDFRCSNAYEDSPWWFPKFYEILHKNFPDAKFILLKRDPVNWFNSLLSHSNGNVVGAPIRHCKIYHREEELKDLLQKKLMTEDQANSYKGDKIMKITPAHQAHYIRCYMEHYNDAVKYFSNTSPTSLFTGNLEDPEKWQKIGGFLNLRVAPDYNSHRNNSLKDSIYNKN